jgi:hypothetical protein
MSFAPGGVVKARLCGLDHDLGWPALRADIFLVYGPHRAAGSPRSGALLEGGHLFGFDLTASARSDESPNAAPCLNAFDPIEFRPKIRYKALVGDSDSPTSAAAQRDLDSPRVSAPSSGDLPSAQVETKPIASSPSEPDPIEPVPVEAGPRDAKFIWPPKPPAPDAERLGTAEGRAAARDANLQACSLRSSSSPTLERDRGSPSLDAGPEAPRRSGSTAPSRHPDAKRDFDLLSPEPLTPPRGAYTLTA